MTDQIEVLGAETAQDRVDGVLDTKKVSDTHTLIEAPKISAQPIVPQEVIKRATEAAKLLKEVVTQTKTSVVIGKKEYLQVEAWQTIGQFNGATTRIAWTRPVTESEILRDVVGYEAKAEVVKDGVVIASAVAMCTTSEPWWKSRPKYGPGGYGGEEPVPDFQRLSMAQTRATAKALRIAYAWIVVLAGYSPTPLEEISDTPAERELRREEKPHPVALPTDTDNTCPNCGKNLLFSKFPLTEKEQAKNPGKTTKLYCPAKCGFRGKLI